MIDAIFFQLGIHYSETLLMIVLNLISIMHDEWSIMYKTIQYSESVIDIAMLEENPENV